MKKSFTNESYTKYVDRISPKSFLLRNFFRAFVVGGLICCIGELITRGIISIDISKETAVTLTSMILIFIGALLTGLNIYDNLGKFAGAGSIVPITGFANSIVAPAMEFKSEGYIMGVGSKMFIIAGPVIIYGIVTSIVSGLIYFIIQY